MNNGRKKHFETVPFPKPAAILFKIFDSDIFKIIAGDFDRAIITKPGAFPVIDIAVFRTVVIFRAYLFAFGRVNNKPGRDDSKAIEKTLPVA